MAASDSYASVSPRSRPADGTAWFTAAIVALGVAAIVTLDRIGAPEGLVRALGPLLALASAAIVGIASRNADLSSYLAARRGVAPRFGGLAFVAIAAGAALALSGGASGSETAVGGVAVGAAIGAGVVGPMLRRFGASWSSDLIATRFPSWPIRLVSGLAIFASAGLTTLAGISAAMPIVAPLFGPNPFSVAALVGTVAAMSVAPGGLAGLLWTACAAGGVMLAMTAVAALLGAPVGFGGDDAAGLGAFSGLAAAAAGAAFFAFEPQAFASASAGRAVKAALIGLVLCIGLLALGGLSPPTRLASLGLDRAAASLAEGARLAAALALASVGAHGAARAFGIPLAAPPRPFPPLASVRLARMRAAQVLVIVLAVLIQARAPVAPQTAISAAMALSLALTAPLLALAALRRAWTPSAGAALAVAAAVLAWRFATAPLPSQPPEFFLPALAAALAGFVVGAAVSLAAPRREAEPRSGPFDPFAGRRR